MIGSDVTCIAYGYCLCAVGWHHMGGTPHTSTLDHCVHTHAQYCVTQTLCALRERGGGAAAAAREESAGVREARTWQALEVEILEQLVLGRFQDF